MERKKKRKFWVQPKIVGWLLETENEIINIIDITISSQQGHGIKTKVIM